MNRLACACGAGLLLSLAAAGRGDDAADRKAAVEKVLKAANADKLKAVTAWTLTETIREGSGGVVVITTQAQLPDRIRVEQSFDTPEGKRATLTVVNGDRGWGKGVDGEVVELPRAGVAARKRLLSSDGFRQVLSVGDPKAEVSLLPGRAVDDKPAFAVRVAVPGESARVFLFDEASGRLVRRETTTTLGTGGREATLATDYSDDREVGGVPVAHKRKVPRVGRPVMASETTELKFLDKHDPRLFDKPE